MSENATAEAPEAPKKEINVEKNEKTPTVGRANMLLIAPEDLVIVGLDTSDGPEHPLYDERIKLPIDKFMVQNVKTFGVKEPILAWKQGSKYLVAAGRQRTRWGREANKLLSAGGEAPLKVRVILEKGDEKEIIGISVLENEVRKDDDMLAKARKAQKLLNRGYSTKEAAGVFGVSVPSFNIWLKVLELHPDVQKAVDEKKITASAALQLRELPQEKQPEALKEVLDEHASRNGGEEESSEDEEKPTIRKKVTAKDVAKKAAAKGAGEKTLDVAQAGAAPKRAQLRRALKILIEKKGQYARVAGAILAWAIGDVDRRKEEFEELSEDVKTALREVIKASAKKKTKKVE